MSLPRLLRRVTPPVIEINDGPELIVPLSNGQYEHLRRSLEQRTAKVRDLEAQLAAAHARIIDLDHQCAELLARSDAQDQTIRRAIRDLSASLQENQQ